MGVVVQDDHRLRVHKPPVKGEPRRWEQEIVRVLLPLLRRPPIDLLRYPARLLDSRLLLAQGPEVSIAASMRQGFR